LARVAQLRVSITPLVPSTRATLIARL